MYSITYHEIIVLTSISFYLKSKHFYVLVIEVDILSYIINYSQLMINNLEHPKPIHVAAVKLSLVVTMLLWLI
jgi:hypothetical protein